MKNLMLSVEESKFQPIFGQSTVSEQGYAMFSALKPFMGNLLVGVTSTERISGDHQAFARAALVIREQEKARLARELHDELAQSLTALKIDTIWIRDNALSLPIILAEKLTEMVEMIDRTVAATRRMAADLRPLMLDDLGLIPAIEWLVNGFIQRNGVSCLFSIINEYQLEVPEPFATAVFRIIQESLNNIAKHAAASEVFIFMKINSGAIKLIIKDNGCGFSTLSTRKPQSLGIIGMHERAQLLGGSVVINSMLAQGTSVEVIIPLDQAGVH